MGVLDRGQRGRDPISFYPRPHTILPAIRQRAVGKDRGETANIERCKHTLRRWLGRPVRNTLSFSKAHATLAVCLGLSLHRYTEECAAILPM